MQIRLSYLETVAVIAIFCSTIWLWTLPIQNNPFPFGDVDASSHFTIGDYMVSTDHSVLKIPYPITFRYAGQNNLLPEYLWYPPQYWTNTAIGQVIGGNRIIPFFIFVAIFSSLIVLSSYFLIRSLFGAWPAILSSFLLMFSTRDYMIYLWGQWPQSLSFAFTPLVLYCVFKYTTFPTKPHTESGEKTHASSKLYVIMASIFLAAQYFFHPQGMIASIGASLLYAVLLGVKQRRIPISIKDAAITLFLVLIIMASFAPFNIGEFFFELVPHDSLAQSKSINFQPSKFFHWYHGTKNDPGLPDFYFTYNLTHGSFRQGIWSWWTLPFLLIGMGVLVLRRRPQELLMLGWFVSYYFLTRLAVFGMGTRDFRMFAYEAHVFYPIIAIGILAIPSLFSNANLRIGTKYGLIVIFIGLALSINGTSAYQVLKGQQFSIGRINPYQFEAAEWIKGNLPSEADIYDFGTLGFQNYAAKVKWLGVLSQRHFIVDDGQKSMLDYVFIDYTDGIFLKQAGQGGADNYLTAIQQFEQQLQNLTPLYNKNNIRVYKVDNINV